MIRKLLLFGGLYFITSSATNCFSQSLPIKPTRTISFTTDEGTNMDVDLSPDGKTLVFDLLGDLYTIPVTGGTATQLTRGVALHTKPIWSPKGKKIACLSDFSGSWHVNVIDIDRGAHTVLGAPDEEQLVNVLRNILWTPDANHVVYSQYDFKYDSVYGLAGGKLPLGVNTKYSLRFSPGGNTLYGIDSDNVYRYNMETKEKTLISPAPNTYKNHCITLSPDARWLCYYDNSDEKISLVLKDLTNGKDRLLISNVAVSPFFHGDVEGTHFCFSSDSKNIYIGYAGKIHSIDIASGNDRIIPFQANVNADLGPFNYNTYRISYNPEKLKYIRHANESADGKHLVFSALDKIYLMDLPHGTPHVLVDQPINQFQPMFSPDGQWIAYVSWNDTLGGHLWRAPVKGGKPEQLTNVPAIYQKPVWSPDGKSIAVIREKPKKMRIAGKQGPSANAEYGSLELISVNNRTEKMIDDSIHSLDNLCFSADGRQIIYTMFKPYSSSNEFDKGQMISRSLDNDSIHIIGTIDWPDGPIDDETTAMSVSPDGKYLIYAKAEELFLQSIFSGEHPFFLPSRSDFFNYRIPFIRFADGIDPCWQQGGQVLSWNYGNRFFRVNVDSIMAAAEREVPDQTNFWSNKPGGYNSIKVKIKPEEVTDINITINPLYAQGTIALKNARILTMARDSIIEHGTIVIKDGRITAIGAVADVSIPAGAKLYDVTGTTIIPGLIDLHLHMSGPKHIFPQQSWMYLVNLAYGVTTARDPAADYADFGYAELLRTGQMTGPRLFTVGKAVGGAGTTRLDNLDDLRGVVQRRLTMGANLIKNYLYWKPRIERQWLSIASREKNMNITNEGIDLIKDIGMMKDGNTGIEHLTAFGIDTYKDVITLFAKSGIYLTPTLQVTEGALGDKFNGRLYFDYTYWRHPDEKLRRYLFHVPVNKMSGTDGKDSIEPIEKSLPKENEYARLMYGSGIAAQIRHQGGKVTLGSHGNDQGIGAHNELWALQMGGLSNMEALQAATIMGAEAIGVQQDLGSLEVGKIADLVILTKNPLDDIHNSREIKYVMKDGILYDGDTLDELWPVKKKLPEWKMKMQ